MRLRTMLGFAALGGAYYAHRRRGGELTLESIQDSLKALRAKVEEVIDSAKDKVLAAKEQAEAQEATIEPFGGASESLPR